MLAGRAEPSTFLVRDSVCVCLCLFVLALASCYSGTQIRKSLKSSLGRVFTAYRARAHSLVIKALSAELPRGVFDDFSLAPATF